MCMFYLMMVLLLSLLDLFRSLICFVFMAYLCVNTFFRILLPVWIFVMLITRLLCIIIVILSSIVVLLSISPILILILYYKEVYIMRRSSVKPRKDQRIFSRTASGKKTKAINQVNRSSRGGIRL